MRPSGVRTSSLNAVVRTSASVVCSPTSATTSEWDKRPTAYVANAAAVSGVSLMNVRLWTKSYRALVTPVRSAAP